jgi:hypothetical protein
VSTAEQSQIAFEVGILRCRQLFRKRRFHRTANQEIEMPKPNGKAAKSIFVTTQTIRDSSVQIQDVEEAFDDHLSLKRLPATCNRSKVSICASPKLHPGAKRATSRIRRSV